MTTTGCGRRRGDGRERRGRGSYDDGDDDDDDGGRVNGNDDDDGVEGWIAVEDAEESATKPSDADEGSMAALEPGGP